jgi:hypothetical protein
VAGDWIEARIACNRNEKERNVMRKGRLAILSLIAVLIAVLFSVPAAGAAGKTYKATLTGAEEVPARPSTASSNSATMVSR